MTSSSTLPGRHSHGHPEAGAEVHRLSLLEEQHNERKGSPVFMSRRERREHERRDAAQRMTLSADVILTEPPRAYTPAYSPEATIVPAARTAPVEHVAHTPEPAPVEHAPAPVAYAPEPAPVVRSQPIRLAAATDDGVPPATRPAGRRPPLVQPKSAAHRPKGRPRRRLLSRSWAKGLVILAATGLVGTAALPAYAYSAEGARGVLTAGAPAQTLRVSGAVHNAALQDNYSILEDPQTLDSTEQSTVSGTVQALAKTLMTAVAQGRLIGSTPDHIPEIRYLAEGKAVPNCGIDYRVLQTIEFALQHFNVVGVSDINRRCTGQIEGAGSSSAHYADGGGHAVDFYILNGHPLTGGDPESLKLIQALDTVVPPGSHVGQSECRADIPLGNFTTFPDTCNHVHLDFITARGATLNM